MPALSWRHHALIQASLSRGPLKEEDFNIVFEAVTGKNPRNHQQSFNEYLRMINKELTYVQFELRGCRNQYDGTVYYGLVNNVADERSKLATKYSAPQIFFYKCVVDAIMQDARAQGCISSIDALNIRLDNQVMLGSQSRSQSQSQSQSQGDPALVPPAIKNFSISQKQKTLDELIGDRWLCSTSDGYIGLGIRSFLDLRNWFRNNDVPSCDVCNEAGVKAELCQNQGCTVRIHLYCLVKKFSGRAERACPACGTPWNCPASVMEAVDEDRKPDVVGRSELLANPTMRKKTKTSVAASGLGSSQAAGALLDVKPMVARRSSRLN